MVGVWFVIWCKPIDQFSIELIHTWLHPVISDKKPWSLSLANLKREKDFKKADVEEGKLAAFIPPPPNHITIALCHKARGQGGIF